VIKKQADLLPVSIKTLKLNDESLSCVRHTREALLSRKINHLTLTHNKGYNIPPHVWGVGVDNPVMDVREGKANGY